MMISASLLCLLGGVYGNQAFPTPLGFEEGDYDFPETDTETNAGWSLLNRCGQSATAGRVRDQRSDPSCPNVLLINTDDMAWADLSINNPSKLIPTPNLDRLVSKGINFRDGHSCTSRCAPSRYCLMTGRYHFRRGDYHYKPMELEYGRKIISHLFKRNNYKTMVVGKPQPVETNMQWNNAEKTDFYFVEGARFWAYDRSFTSRSYCCLPGGGYFVNDTAQVNFDKYALFHNFRNEVPGMKGAIDIDPAVEEGFYAKPENWHLLDGYTVDGNPASARRPTTYMAYWNALKNNIDSGLNSRRRRRRNAEGVRFRRGTIRNRRQAGYVAEVVRPNRTKPKRNYVRFQERSSNRVIVADFKLKEGGKERYHYEFGGQEGGTFESYAEAERARLASLDAYLAIPGNAITDVLYRDMKKTRPKKTQVGFDSKLIMNTFKETAQEYLTEHVNWHNPIKPTGTARTAEENVPFFMYLSFRAPHRPFSHNKTFDEDNPEDHLPYRSLGKPTEQIGIFDKHVGELMTTLHDLDVADNTLIFFTSDNGPDQGMFHTYNRWGHINIGMMRGKKASIYEGGHRVPFLSWWPLGTHQALHGTNFDLPVSQVDFFATFADILDYPLPKKESCVYAYDSNNAHVHRQDATKLGRPTDFGPKNSWPGKMRQYNAGNTGWATGYTSEVVMRGTSKNDAMYLREVQTAGFSTVERWHTKEEFTGFLLGWEGCMAEDSQSFADAFKAVKTEEVVRDGATVHKFRNKLEKVPTKIFAGKLGDVTMRLGRYKLVRFNPPKDYRTGPNRQHLTRHTPDEGTPWLQGSWGDRCVYDEDGVSLNPSCTIEPLCRNYTTFGDTACMRDHYYQLWDLEKNFGEKTFCSYSSRTKTPNNDLESALFGAVRPRDNGDGTKAPEKPPDKHGYGSGMESTPIGEWVNDCCVLNLDEKNEDSIDQRQCGNRRIKRHGVETTGGTCKKIPTILKKGKTFEEFKRWSVSHQNWALHRRGFANPPYNWTDAYFAGFPNSADDFEPGYGCSNMAVAFPDKSNIRQTENYIWDESIGDYRHSTFADRLCIPEEKLDIAEFELGCKVPDHNGPLAEGWEGNSQWHASTIESRRTDGVENGDINPSDFGEWAEFTSCLKDVLSLIEGQAYAPETTEDIRIYGITPFIYVDTNQMPLLDDGANGTYVTDDILAGGQVGTSGQARTRAEELWSRIKRPNDSGDRFFHGAGSRYVERDDENIADRCKRFLPKGAADPYDIRPNFDLEMDLLGWYESSDGTGGNIKELVVDGTDVNGEPIYSDDRTLQKYYRKHNNKWLTAFEPEYL